MRLQLSILILLLTLSGVVQTSFAASVHIVDDVVIAGADYTDPALLRRYIPVKAGTSVMNVDLVLAEERINALNIAANAKVTQTYSGGKPRVLVRVNDGQGFVVEPIEFTVGSIINLMLGTVKLVYHNLGGKAINPYAVYNISNGELHVGAETPGIMLPVFHDFGYHTAKSTFPTSSGNFTVDKREVYFETSCIPYPGWRPSGKLTWSSQKVQKPDSSDWVNENWTLYQVRIPYHAKQNNLEYSVEFSYTKGMSISNTSFEKRTGSIDIILHQQEYSFRIGGIIGRTTDNTPADQFFYLGGQELQKGYEAQSFWGKAVVNTVMELGYQLVPNSVELKTFAELGYVGPSLKKIGASEAKVSLGLGIDLPNPSGLLRVFIATPGDKWQPRFALTFQL